MEIDKRYDNTCDVGEVCDFIFGVKEKIDPPSYILLLSFTNIYLFDISQIFTTDWKIIIKIIADMCNQETTYS